MDAPPPCPSDEHVANVRDHGATGDGRVLNTAAVAGLDSPLALALAHSFTFIYIHLRSFTFIYIHFIHSFTFILYIHLHSFTFIYIHSHAFTFIYIHSHAFTFICIHLHSFTCIYIHSPRVKRRAYQLRCHALLWFIQSTRVKGAWFQTFDRVIIRRVRICLSNST